jgi:hypothetical protein
MSSGLNNTSGTACLCVGYRDAHKIITIYVWVTAMARSREIFSPLFTEMLTAGWEMLSRFAPAVARIHSRWEVE